MSKMSEFEKMKERMDVLEQKYVNPLQDSALDAAVIEGIFSILRKRCGVTEPEIGACINKYGSTVSAILGILYDKHIATPEDINREVIAFHHVLRMVGINGNLSLDQINQERESFVLKLEKIGK